MELSISEGNGLIVLSGQPVICVTNGMATMQKNMNERAGPGGVVVDGEC